MSAFNVYNGNGTQTLFPITFSYFSGLDIEVWLWNATTNTWQLCTESVNYIINGNNIEIIDTNVGGGALGGIPGLGGPPGGGPPGGGLSGSAPPVPPAGITGNVLIVRRTNIGGYSGPVIPKAAFQAGTSINAADLNDNQTQVLRAIQDAQASNVSNPGTVSGAGVLENKIYSNLDLTGREITNIGTALSDNSAINREMLGDIIFTDITSDSTQGVVLNKTAGGTNSGDQMVITAENSSPTQKGTVIIAPDGSVNVVYSNGTATIGVDKSTPLQQGVVTITSTSPIGVDNTVDGEVNLSVDKSTDSQQGVVQISTVTPIGIQRPTDGEIILSIDKSNSSQLGVVKISSTTPISIDRPTDGEVQLSVLDDSVDLSKLKSSQIVTSTEQTNNVPDWTNNDLLIATVGAIAKRNDLIYQNSTPIGLDFAVGRLWYDHDNAKSLNTWDGSKWETITKQGVEILETPKTLQESRVISSDTNALVIGPVAVGAGVELTIGSNSQLIVHSSDYHHH